MSQSQYSLNASTAIRPPSSSPSLDEFGRRRPTPVAFPTPSHAQSSLAGSTNGSTASYNPPYAPSSLTPASPSHHLAKPHRSSFSSYGMTQHDIDSMLRPLSSLSIGGSVNKPLPLPQPNALQPLRPTSSAGRPQSGQGFAMAPQPTPSPTPYSNMPATLPHPGMQHHHSQPVDYQQANETYAVQHPHPPTHHHRHSMTTYLPDGGDVPWNANQIPLVNGHHRSTYHDTGPHHPSASDQPNYNQSNTTWQDPRATSPYPSNPGYGVASPTQSATYHPTALQPGTSPQFSHVSPPPLPHSPLPNEPPVWNSASHYSSPVLGEHLRQSEGQDGQFNNFFDQQQYQPQQPPFHSEQEQVHDGYAGVSHSGQYHEAAGQQSGGGQYQDYQGDQQQQQYGHDQGVQQIFYDSHNQPIQQQYDNGYSQSGYTQPQSANSYSQAPLSQRDQYDYQTQPPVPQSSHLQQDYRISSPYRPLPQPTPDPAASPHYQQQHYPPQPGYEPPQAPPPRQPRFGLPVHQVYDPPYIPPSSRQSQHQQTPYQPQIQQVPPPIPPVPQELRQDHYGSYGYNGNRY